MPQGPASAGRFAPGHYERAWLGTTFFVTEHDMRVVFGLASRIFVLHQGSLLAAGTPEEVRRDPRVREAYLGGEVDG